MPAITPAFPLSQAFESILHPAPVTAVVAADIIFMKTPLPCGAVAPMEVVSFGGHKTLTYF